MPVACRHFIVGLGALLVLAGCALLPPQPGPPEVTRAQWPLAHCTEAMDRPGFWLDKLDQPEAVLLAPQAIARLNQQTRQRGLLTDVFSDRLWDYKNEEVDRPEEVNPDGEWDIEKPMLYSPGVVDGYRLYTYLKDETERIKSRPRWDAQGAPMKASVFKAWDDNLNLGQLKENNPLGYGLTLRRSNVRYYPTDQVVAGRRWDHDFDIVQVSSVRAFQPLVILHHSRDQRWYFVVSPFCRGWIKAKDMAAYCNPKTIADFITAERKLVVTGHKVTAWRELGNTRTAEAFYMGTVCRLLDKNETGYTIALPKRNDRGGLNLEKAFIARGEDVYEDFLPYSRAQIIRQAFKLLHHPYSWGGQREYRDCSQMVMDVFASMGIFLPRNSSAQARVGSSHKACGRELDQEQKIAALQALNGPALLQFPGHIMLFLGMHEGRPYAIHDIWSYRVFKAPGVDDKVVIGQVVVSDLSLGEGSNRGSLLERLTTINRIRP